MTKRKTVKEAMAQTITDEMVAADIRSALTQVVEKMNYGKSRGLNTTFNINLTPQQDGHQLYSLLAVNISKALISA